ncbi:TolC family protein [Pedobacter sp. LMG 31464]|uniref:TolC family protein n=1 Tax=Pedobacter planticolens TaxID=2679964 RepID=A0A923E1K0_9SPHI|nr:TolC family protein [Pedobacter planticolens]MBB2147041.1 TolC family protein [Pedobacter planticolens]
MKQVANFSFLTKLTFILSLVITGFSQKSFAQEVITIQQAVENTLKNNLQVKQAEFSTALSDENLRQSKNALYPTLNGSANYNKNFGRSIDPSTNQYISQQFSSASGSLSAGADLFQGFAKLNQIRQNKILLDADKTNVDKIKNDLILSVVTSYMQILYNKDLLAASDQQLTVAKQTLNREQALLDAGNKTLADVSQAKSQVATAELNVTNAQNNLSISYLNLNQLMEMPSNSKFEVQAPLVNDNVAAKNNYDINEIYSSAVNTFPDIKLAALRTAAAAKGIDLAKANYSPRLSLGAGLGSNYSSGRQELISSTPNGTREIGRTAITNEAVVIPNFTTLYANQKFKSQIQDNFNQSIGLSLQIPIFNGFSARSAVRKAKINYQNTQVQEQLTKNNLSKVISQAVADLKAAEGRYSSTTNAFTAQKDAYYVIEQRYNVGLVNSLDYSTALTNKNKAEIDMIQAKYDLIFRAKVIDYYLGKQIVF